MLELKEVDDQVMAIIAKNPYFLEKTIIKEIYLRPRARSLFRILKEEYSRRKEFILSELQKHNDFDILYFTSLYTWELYDTSRDIKFNEFEKELIDRYKNEMANKLVENYKGNPNELYAELTKLKNINYNENECLSANEMIEILEKKNEQIKIGYPKFDNFLNLSKNDLVILAGGTGTGKTAFALNLLNNLSKDYQCIYFNQEMSKNIIYRRLTAITAQVDIKRLKRMNELTSYEWNRINCALSELEDRKIILINKSVSIQEIEHSIANVITKKHVVAIVDHIGLIKANGKSLYEKATEIAKDLRRISINYDCTIIGLCQLSRSVQRNETMPTIQDLRDSGEIEQSARKIILLYNENPTEDAIQEMKIIIGKNDDGDKLIQTFKFDKYKQTFMEM